MGIFTPESTLQALQGYLYLGLGDWVPVMLEFFESWSSLPFLGHDTSHESRCVDCSDCTRRVVLRAVDGIKRLKTIAPVLHCWASFKWYQLMFQVFRFAGEFRESLICHIITFHWNRIPGLQLYYGGLEVFIHRWDWALRTAGKQVNRVREPVPKCHPFSYHNHLSRSDSGLWNLPDCALAS